MIDVIIPVYRPDEKLEKLIEGLNRQTQKPDHVIFMQTLTGDAEDQRVRSILERADHAVIIPVDKNEFDHGGTRNQGAALSDASYMLFMTQDAVPADDRLIACMIEAVQKEESVAAVYARQLADDQVGVIEQFTRRFNYPDKSMVKDKTDLKQLGIKTYFCSNVCAMYRKDVYKKMGGFVTKTIFNEDMILAASVIDAGYKIAYAADAKVVHAHKYTYWQQLTRNFDMAVSQRQYHHIFDGVKSESEGVRLVKDTIRYLIQERKWYLIPDLIMQSGFKYIGYKLGLNYEKIPMWAVKRLSMNKRYWNER